MGTKRELAPFVAQFVQECRAGPFLDLFAGTCAVGSAVGIDRAVWSNDVQYFATEVARALTTSRDTPIQSILAAHYLYDAYKKNRDALATRLQPDLENEKKALKKGDASTISKLQGEYSSILNDESLMSTRYRLARKPSTFPYRLFTQTYAGTYFGLYQCIQIDSIRYAIDQATAEGTISRSDRRWSLLALCQSVSRVATSTGHFAQFLRIHNGNEAAFVSQRRRSVWICMLDALDEFSPIGSFEWRKGNRVFRRDAVALLRYLKDRGDSPGVIYADPPYTRDQYSRYYHLYETLLFYDYPKISGYGRYRLDRYSSTFSLKSRVVASINQLIKHAASLSSELLLSYPENGLLKNPTTEIVGMLKSHYSFVNKPIELNHLHSSLGASKGLEKSPVKELLFWAK